MEQLIDEHIHSIRDRRVMKLRFIDGLTYEEIAEEVDRTPRQVGYIISKYSVKLSEYLL